MDTPTKVFPCEISEIFNNTFFAEHMRSTASEACYEKALWYKKNLSMKFLLIFLSCSIYETCKNHVLKQEVTVLVSQL